MRGVKMALKTYNPKGKYLCPPLNRAEKYLKADISGSL